MSRISPVAMLQHTKANDVGRATSYASANSYGAVSAQQYLADLDECEGRADWFACMGEVIARRLHGNA